MAAGESARRAAQRRAVQLLSGARRLLGRVDTHDRAADVEIGPVLGELPYGWTVLPDVRGPGRRGATLGHVAIGPGGVYVIDTRNWAGSVSVTGGALFQDGRSRNQVVSEVTEAARAVAGVIDGVPVVPVLCFVRNEPLAGWAGDVMVCSTSNVVAMLTSRPTSLQPATISRLVPDLVRNLAPASGAAAGPAMSDRSSTRRQRPRRRPTRYRRRTPRVPAGRIALLALTLCAIVALVPSGKAMVSGLVKEGVQRALEPAKPVGTTQTVAADSTHPELAIRVGSVADTHVVGRRAAPVKGRRLVAVPIAITDKGGEPWAWSQGTAIALVDAAGNAHAPTQRYQHVSAGKLLAAAPRVPAHRQVEGVVVFEVPAGTHVSSVRIVIGPRLPVTLRWNLGD